ncbi:MAG: hypothetical protein NC434_15235, partial [Ruminococcus sp.]|nr:hypothetical protein [Ruminococcus sp.]
METKRVTEDFSDRSIWSWTLDVVRSTMDMIETLFEDCDAELTNAEMSPLGYEKQDISTMLEHLIILRNYVSSAHGECYDELDHPLYTAFKNGATSTLSNIVLNDITTENTFGMEEYVRFIEIDNEFYTKEIK